MTELDQFDEGELPPWPQNLGNRSLTAAEMDVIRIRLATSRRYMEAVMDKAANSIATTFGIGNPPGPA